MGISKGCGNGGLPEVLEISENYGFKDFDVEPVALE